MTVPVPVALTVVTTVAFLVAERVFPGRGLPQSRGWYVRALAVNGVQLAITLVARRLWADVFASASIFHVARWRSPSVEGAAAWLVGTFVFYRWHRVPPLFCVRLRPPRRGELSADMRINWLRVLGGGFLIEVVLAIVLIGGFAAAGVDLAKGVSTVSAVIIGVGCFVGAFVVVAWLARGIDHQRAWNGLLMGVVATLLYLGLVAGSGQMAAALAAYGPATFVIVNGMRLLGALLGGIASERRSGAPPEPERASASR